MGTRNSIHDELDIVLLELENIENEIRTGYFFSDSDRDELLRLQEIYQDDVDDLRQQLRDLK